GFNGGFPFPTGFVPYGGANAGIQVARRQCQQFGLPRPERGEDCPLFVAQPRISKPEFLVVGKHRQGPYDLGDAGHIRMPIPDRRASGSEPQFVEVGTELVQSGAALLSRLMPSKGPIAPLEEQAKFFGGSGRDCSIELGPARTPIDKRIMAAQSIEERTKAL